MIDIIKWHDASKERPKKSGDYLVRYNRKGWYRPSTSMYHSLHYSVTYDAFNTNDFLTPEEAEEYKIDDVAWWASLDDIETREEEVMPNEPI